MEKEVSNYYAYETIYTILTPEELARIVENFHVVITNAHVPVGYTESPQEEFMDNYRQLYQLLIAGEKLEWKTHYNLFQMRDLTKHLSHCKYDGLHTYRGKQYLSPCFDEPCPHVSRFNITIHKNSTGKIQFCKTVDFSQYPQYTVGLSFSIPTQKYIYNGGIRKDLKDTDGYADFKLLKDRIKKETEALRIVYDGNFYKPSVRIGKGAKEKARNYWFFQEKCIEIL